MILSNKKALTLTELIVASILMGIVMLGIASFNYAIKGIQDSTNKSAVLAMQSQAALAEITRAANLATGDQSNLGIKCRLPTGITGGGCDAASGVPYFSFRKDTLNTPDNYADDQWTVFTSGTSGTFTSLYSCTQDAATGPVPNTGGACAPAGKTLLLSKIITGGISYDFDPTKGIFFVITITTRYDPNTAKDNNTNPEYTLSTKITPPMHSW